MSTAKGDDTEAYKLTNWDTAPRGVWRMEYRHREFDAADEWGVLHPKHIITDLDFAIKEISSTYRRYEQFQYRLVNTETGEIIPGELFA